MRVSWTGDADVNKLTLKLGDEDEKIVTVTVAAVLDAFGVEQTFGVELRRLVFDSLKESHTVSCDRWKPRAVFEAHVVSFNGHDAVPTLPKIDKIEPAGDRVRVFLKLPFVLGDRGLFLALVDNFNGPIEVELQPEQGSLLESVVAKVAGV